MDIGLGGGSCCSKSWLMKPPMSLRYRRSATDWRDRPGENQARYLARRLGYHWIFRPASMFWPFPPLAEGLAYLTREPAHFNFYSVPRVRWAGPARIILHIQVAGFDIYNVHFPLTERARIVEATQLTSLARERGHKPSILVGDFNADEHQAPMQILWEAGFVDLWHALSVKGEPPPAWPGDRRIDYVLGFGLEQWSGSMRTVGVEPEPSGLVPSDHPGVLVNLTP